MIFLSGKNAFFIFKMQNKENKQDVLSAASVSVNRRTSQK